MRVRLKADGRIVEILADGSERAIAGELVGRTVCETSKSPLRLQVAAQPDAAYAARRARPNAAHPGRVRRAHRRADRNRAQLGAGQALPRGPARALLKVIERAPDVAFAVLSNAKPEV